MTLVFMSPILTPGTAALFKEFGRHAGWPSNLLPQHRQWLKEQYKYCVVKELLLNGKNPSPQERQRQGHFNSLTRSSGGVQCSSS